jgi:hypothetical protein
MVNFQMTYDDDDSSLAKRRKADDALYHDLFVLIVEKNPFNASWGTHSLKWTEIFEAINQLHPGSFADVPRLRDCVNSRLRRLLTKHKSPTAFAELAQTVRLVVNEPVRYLFFVVISW